MITWQYIEERLDILWKGEGYYSIHNSLRDDVKMALTFEVG